MENNLVRQVKQKLKTKKGELILWIRNCTLNLTKKRKFVSNERTKVSGKEKQRLNKVNYFMVKRKNKNIFEYKFIFIKENKNKTQNYKKN